MKRIKVEEAPLTDAEISRRRDAAIKRALNTPPKPLKEYIGKGPRSRRRSVKRADQEES